ncbi:unnamed protein product [Ilex paraguariensis]|uniref:Uncharacterized protein n=1 Tax=Ilex paraguariensis TaxID=185542 RepID=A0ABC8SID3_9AQUA
MTPKLVEFYCCFNQSNIQMLTIVFSEVLCWNGKSGNWEERSCVYDEVEDSLFGKFVRISKLITMEGERALLFMKRMIERTGEDLGECWMDFYVVKKMLCFYRIKVRE